MKNYCPLSLLPIVSKLFERNMYNQILTYRQIPIPLFLGLEKDTAWKKAIYEKECAGGILTDLSKGFECLNHDLLIAKLNAYGFSQNALLFICSYIKRKETKNKR